MNENSVLYLQRGDAFGACEGYILDLVEATSARDAWVPGLVAPSSDSIRPLCEQASEFGARVSTYPGEQGLLRSIREIQSVVQRANPDLVHVNDYYPAALVGSRLGTSSPLVVTHHTPELDRDYSWWGKTTEALARIIPEAWIFTSEADRATAGQVGSRFEERGHVIPYGLDLGDFDTGARCDEPNGEVQIGTTGRLVEQKNYRRLIRVADIVEGRARAPVKFRIAGKGPQRQTLEREIAERNLEGTVELVGWVDDVPHFLDELDVFVMTSDFEGLCYSVLEAMAAGLPVVSTAVGGIQDSMVDGRTGFLHDRKDEEGLAGSLVELVESEHRRAKMGEAARRRIEKRYTVERMIADTLSLYEDLLGG